LPSQEYRHLKRRAITRDITNMNTFAIFTAKKS
jgi:hypothetical protein